MKKIKNILYIVLIISIIAISFLGINIQKDSYSYMTEEQVGKAVAKEFYEKSAQILINVGTMASFYDKYGSDDTVVPHTDGYTVGELKEIYINNPGELERQREYINNIFYYSEDMEDEENTYSSSNGKNINDYVSKFGFNSYDQYIEEKDKANAIYNFLNDYSFIRDIEKNSSVPSNLEYIISYTNIDGNVKTYESNNSYLLSKKSIKFNKYFLFDRKNSMITIHNINMLDADYNNLVYKCKTFTDYDDFYVYIAINADYPYNDMFSHLENEVVTDKNEILEHNLFVVLFIFCIVMFVASIFLLTSWTNNDNSTDFTMSLDKIWWDASAALTILMALWIIVKTSTQREFKFYTNKDYLVPFGIIDLAVFILCLIWLSVARRYKNKTLWKTSFVGMIISHTLNAIKVLGSKMSATWKTVIIAVLSIAFAVGYGQLYSYGIVFRRSTYLMALIAYCALALIIVIFFSWMFFSEYSDISKETKRIAEGDINHKINKKLYYRSNIKMAEAVNSIGDGIIAAVEKSIKNERMKTDLITNVSHDIKTPLTSIINYVNLMKAEEINNEKTKDYLRILDDKSQRLKVLIDDLVEASKLSSGVIEMNLTKLNLVELVKQSAGEFEEKFEENDLEVVVNIPKYPVYVNADGRKMWRVLENLYGNICKYAMPGTRVYADLECLDRKVVLTIKNISMKPMNFEGNDLTERFIRGDVSRTTEGSGLGLSIAKTIIDRHNGEFKIILDGDLFKAIIILDTYEENE